MGWLKFYSGGEISNTWPEVEGPTASRLDRARLVRMLYNRNPRRWRRFTKDFRHYQRVMKRLGRNPEDVRFLLP